MVNFKGGIFGLMVLGLVVLGAGFWFLYKAFLISGLLQGGGGGLFIILGMWLITRSRRSRSGVQ